MTTVLLVLAATVFPSFQSLFSKLFSGNYKSDDASLTSVVFSIAYGLFTGIVTLFLCGFRFSASPVTVVCGLLNAVSLFFYNMCMIKAARLGSYSIQILFMIFGSLLLPLAVDALFMGKPVSLWQLAAIALMMAAFVLMNLNGLTFKGASKKFLMWCVILFFANGAFCVLLNIQQKALGGAERNEMVILTYVVMSLMNVVIQLVKKPKALISGFKMDWKCALYLLAACVCATFTSHMTLAALKYFDKAAVLYTFINGGVLILSVFYSFILFKERLNKPQWAGVLLAVVGIVMLSLL